MRISDWSSDVCSSDLILSAAERLMQAPDWADFEPGVLIPEIPVPVTTTTPPQSDTVDDAEFMETQLEGGQDGASQLDLLLLENTAAVASSEERRVGKEWDRPCKYRWSPSH